jgi:PIN domain nuclease of toxin-antitoxin system
VGPVRLLLDTHALLWWIFDDPRLPAAARSAMSAPRTRVLVSSASAWEIATKHRLGKLPEAGDVAEFLPDYVRRARFTELQVSIAHALKAGRLPGPHKDPFDRLLIAQATLENTPVVTLDPVFATYGVETVWG